MCILLHLIEPHKNWFHYHVFQPLSLVSFIYLGFVSLCLFLSSAHTRTRARALSYTFTCARQQARPCKWVLHTRYATQHFMMPTLSSAPSSSIHIYYIMITSKLHRAIINGRTSIFCLYSHILLSPWLRLKCVVVVRSAIEWSGWSSTARTHALVKRKRIKLNRLKKNLNANWCWVCVPSACDMMRWTGRSDNIRWCVHEYHVRYLLNVAFLCTAEYVKACSP